ncbi:MAG: glycosyl hydrolase family 18 protein [Candidatus Aquirickettsiella sp.]
MNNIKNIQVVPWDHQSGAGPFNVIFDSNVWKNEWWAEVDHCPAKWQEDPKHNPWRILRAATSAEIALGNPTSCDGAADCSDLLCKDPKTEATYQQVGYKADGSGTHLSYTSARVAKTVYNRYEKSESKPKLSAYITDWCQYDGRLQNDTDPTQAGRSFDLTKIDPNAFDRIIFSFMGICGDFGDKAETLQKSVDGWNKQAPNAMRKGHIVLMDPWGDLATYTNVGLSSSQGHMDLTYDNYLQYYQQDKAAGLLGGMRELKKKNPDLKYSFSVGGWTLSGFFSDMVKNQDMREEFIDSTLDFMNRFPMFDGIDIDWEYPGATGNAGNHFDPENDGKNYTLLISELRIALDFKFGKNQKTITIAMSADPEKMKFSNIADLKKAGLDFIFLMSYDFFGTGWAPSLAHHSNLEKSQLSDFAGLKALAYLVSEGIPSNMIHLGVANYARAAAEAELSSLKYNIQGKALGSFENGAYEFFDLINNVLDLEANTARGKNGFTLMTDTDADADILYNTSTKHYISLETPRTAKNKGEYVKNNNLAGCFSWSCDQDDGLLTNACREGMGYQIIKENFAMADLYNKGKEFNMPKKTKK